MSVRRYSKNNYFKIVIFLVITIYLIFYPFAKQTKVVEAADNYIYFPQDIIYFSESNGISYIPVEVVKGNWYTATAYFVTQDTTAVMGTDYYIFSSRVSTKYAGATSILMTITNDTIIEDDEEFVITFTSGDILNDPANGCYASCTVVIVDDDGVSDPDSCILASTSMTPSLDTIAIGDSLSFNLQHNIEVTDNSASGLGWELILNFEEYIKLEENMVNDPCITGINDFMQVKIPTSNCLESITVTSIEFPDGTIDNSSISVDLTGIQTVNDIASVIVTSDDSGDLGVFYVTILMQISFENWLPEGTILTAGGNCSRFDQNHEDVLDDEYFVANGDKIQIFAGCYNWNIEYNAIRVSAP